MVRMLGKINITRTVRCVKAVALVAFLAPCSISRVQAQSLRFPERDEVAEIGIGALQLVMEEGEARQQPSSAQQPASSTQTPPATNQQSLPDAPKPASSSAAGQDTKTGCVYPPCQAPTNWYMRFLNGPQVKPLTPKEKAWLAVRNLADPFNAVTILGVAAISVGADSHSAYGPGMAGFGKYVGVSYTEDLTGEFFGTFLIPSVVHQDPQ